MCAWVYSLLIGPRVDQDSKGSRARPTGSLDWALLSPVLKINDHATGGRRTKDILGGPKGWGPKKKVANVKIYVIFEVFVFCSGRTKTDFKDRASHEEVQKVSLTSQ